MRLNPLTYGVAAFRRTLYWTHPAQAMDLPSLPLALIVTVIFGLFFFALSFALVGRGRTA